jgi:serine/threonine protein kinase
MTIQCPYCRHTNALANPKAGKFRIKCPKCAAPFQLEISADAGVAPVVAKLEDLSAARSNETVEHVSNTPSGFDPNATAPHGSFARGNEGGPARTEAASDPGATADFAGAVAAASESAREQLAESRVLGGYKLERKLGQGGMGEVYLARQLSLDRAVALKVMRPQWSSNPTFVARFTREAYAAAQLVHHNVVQIYDFGEDRESAYFSMEFVDGMSLGQLTAQKKVLDPEQAAGYVLQAARGLKFAHDRSMIHRDVKPDNLLINRRGVVKVADLGLVKTPESVEAEEAAEAAQKAGVRSAAEGISAEITRPDIAMGTPAFMAPEQARNAAAVDQRADIYALGCTLYHLVTGRPPFEGRTAVEVMTKHQTEPITPPDLVAKRVPKALSGIILKMTAKRPEDRYSDLGEVIKDLREYLGLSAAGPFTPREDHAELLERSVAQFNATPLAKIRALAILGGIALVAILFLVLVWRQPHVAFALLLMGLVSTCAYFILNGVTRRSYLFDKAREFVLGGKWTDWLMIGFGVLVVVFGLWVFGLLFWVLLLGAVGVGVAFGIWALLDRPIAAQRSEPIEAVEKMLRSMRLKGLDEDAIRQFVCKYGGRDWEEFFEGLFGYEAKREARTSFLRGETGRSRREFGSYRDPVIKWLEGRIDERRRAKEQGTLQKIEEKNLEAKGENLLVARRKARRAAEAMVAVAAESRTLDRTAGGDQAVAMAIGKALRDAATQPDQVLDKFERGKLVRRPGMGLVGVVLGGRVRFLAGAALLATSLLWLHQNDVFSSQNLEKARAAASVAAEKAKKAAESGDAAAIAEVAKLDHGIDLPKEMRPLEFMGKPAPFSNELGSWGALAAGVILAISSLWSGVRMALFAMPAAGLALLGHRLGLPAIGGLPRDAIGMAAGGVLFVVGLVFGRR